MCIPNLCVYISTILQYCLPAISCCYLTDEIFIQYMHSYLLTEEQLAENGYPRPTHDPGVASIVRKPDDVSDIKPVGPNGTVTICGDYLCVVNNHVNNHVKSVLFLNLLP